MLEKMSEFFDNRIDGYDEHMMTCIESAEEFYPYTAECLPVGNNVNVLDLGCGTGLELEYYFKINPTASVTGIDLTESMLNVLKKKFTDKNLNLILGSYFDLPFGIEIYDAAVSVESLHNMQFLQSHLFIRGIDFFCDIISIKIFAHIQSALRQNRVNIYSPLLTFQKKLSDFLSGKFLSGFQFFNQSIHS